MGREKMKKFSVFLILIMGLFFFYDQAEAAGSSQLIIVNKKTNTLAFYDKGKLNRIFSVGTGRSSDLTPEGKFQVVTKLKNRPYYKEGIPGGDPRNPLGDRWLGINARGTYGDTYAIHGNNNANSIGKYVSSGCIRMYNTEVRWLYDQVARYTPVVITSSSSSFDTIATTNGFTVAPTNGWVKVNSKWYFYANGEVKTGWYKHDGKWYYSDSNGVMKTGWVSSGGKWYYLDKNGVMKTGWLSYGNKWYYLDQNGAMKTGWQSQNGKWYYLEKSGIMKTGWMVDKGQWYYLEKSGVMKTGWLTDKGQWYYLDKNGAMKTGWLVEKGHWYYLEKNGSMRTGWLQSKNKWYYLNKNGQMAVNTIIEGYRIGQDGAWIQVTYVALGDSLAAGMTPEGIDRPPVNGVDPDWGYPNYIAQEFKKSYQLLGFHNFGVSGYKLDDVITDLKKDSVKQSINKATHLTIDIGANDLLPVLQTNPTEVPAELAKAAAKLDAILSTIDQLNPKIKVYVMGYYNPFPYVSDPQTKAQFEQLLQAFNEQIEGMAARNGDAYVPTSHVINVNNFADYLPNPQDIHLSLLGYQVIAGEFWKVIK